MFSIIRKFIVALQRFFVFVGETMCDPSVSSVS